MNKMIHTRKDVWERLRAILKKVLKLSHLDVNEDSKLMDDLGADSVEIWDIAVAIEKEFSFKFTKNEVEKLETVGDLLTLLEMKAER